MLSLGIWHGRVSLYMVYHLPEYLPGSRKLKVLEEKLFFQRDYPRPDSSQRWGWTCQVHTSYRALLLLQHSCIWKGALGKFCLLILIEIKIFTCLSKLWPEIPPQSLAHNPAHPGKWEWNSQQLWLPIASWIFIALSHTKHIFFLEKKKKHSRSLHIARFFSSLNSQMWSKHSPVWQSICELEQTLPSLQLAVTPWSRSSSLPGSSLGFTQQLGSMQPQPVGFDCCRRRVLHSGMQSGKQASNPLCSQQTQKRSCGFKGQRVWMGVTRNLQGEFWWSWVCSGARSIPGATLLTSMPYAFSVRSSFVFSPELTGPGI